MLRFTDPVSGYSFTIHSYQWGFTDGIEYVTRDYGVTPYGTWFRQGTEHNQRQLKVRFVGTDDVLDQLQMMSMLVMRHGERVQFFPDAAITGTYWWVLWPIEAALTRVIENREEMELTMQEVGEGATEPPTTETVVLAFTFYGQYPMAFCTVDGVPVPPPAVAYIGDDDPHSSQEGGIMVLDSGIFGVNGVELGNVVRTQVWPANLSALSGETIGSLTSIASNRTDKFYGLRYELSPAPSGDPQHAGVLPQPPVPTGITATGALGAPSNGGGQPPGFYEIGILFLTPNVYPHVPGSTTYPLPSDLPPDATTSWANIDCGAVVVGPLASVTVPPVTHPVTGYVVNWTTTFPTPATYSPYFGGLCMTIGRKDGGSWRMGSWPPLTPASNWDGVLPFPGFRGAYGGPSTYYLGRFSGTIDFGGGSITPYPYPYTNTSATGPWHDGVLVEFDTSGHLTGNTWRLFHLADHAGPPLAVAVDRNMTVAYWSRYDPYEEDDTIYDAIFKTVLSTGVVSRLAAEPDHYIYTPNSIRVLGSGDVLVLWTNAEDDSMVVKRYSSTGTVLATYPITSSGYEGLLAHGIDDTNFWVCFTRDVGAPYWSIDRLVNIDVATGVELHAFDSPFFLPPWFVGDDWDWTYIFNPFCVTRI